jgi:minimal PKS ketosynthase (KS/KS alpha)
VSDRGVAVTGVGVIAPGGIGGPAFLDLLTAGRTATRRITRFDPSPFRSQIAAECDFAPAAAGLTPRQVRRMDLYVQYGVAAAAEAIADSGLDAQPPDLDRAGTTMGSAVGGTVRLEEEYVLACDAGAQWLADHRYVHPYAYEAWLPSSLASEVASAFGLRGPAATVSTGCTSGLDAIGDAAMVIEDGAADVMIAGAADSPISPISVACFDAIRATSPRNDEPARASRPFDRDRQGFVLGEGGAVLVLEETGHARRRGARVYCEVTGYATRSNAYHMTGLTEHGTEMSDAIDDALRQSRLDPADVHYINAHGSGTKQNDRHETAAFKRSLGHHAYDIPVSSIKSMVGHSLGGIGAIEAAACVLAIANSFVPPTANLENPDPECDLDYVPVHARAQRVDNVLSVGSGFGGFQTALVLRREAGAR